MNQQGKITNRIYGIAAFCAAFLLIVCALHGAPRATSSLPANLFTGGQTCKFDGLVKGAVWSISDWKAKVVANGTLASGTALAGPALPIGYYKLSVKQSGATYSVPFGVIIDPAKRIADPQSPYAVDSAQAWQGGTGAGRDLNAAAELARLAGVTQARDRISWKDANSARGTYNWNGYTPSVQALDLRGVDILNVFSGAPAWTRTEADDLPNDLFALYDFAKAAGQKFTGSISAWEFWNEPDLDSCRDPAWEFATAQKAAYLGFKAGAPAAKVLMGSNAVTPTSRFFEVALENGMGTGFDIFNTHFYGSDNTFPDIIDEKKQLLARFGLANTPIWVTEVGTAKSEIGGASPIVGSNREHSEAQERTQAEHLVKSLTTLHALNVQRFFYFLLLPYNENNGQKPWGLLRWDWTAKPAYCALANVTATMAGHDYVGPIALNGVDALLFEKRGQSSAARKQTVVFWASGNDVSVAAAWAKGAQLTDLMGTPRTLAVNASGQPLLQAGSSPQFLTNVTPMGKPAVLPKAPAPPALQPVVLGFSPADPSIVINRTALNLPSTGAGASLKIWNFSNQSRSVSLVNASEGVQIGTLPASVTLQAREVRTLPLTVRSLTTSVDEPMIKITGSSSGMPVGPLVVPVRPASAAAFNRTKVTISSTGVWRKNASGTLTLAGDAAANSMRFTTQFPANTDWWVYPALMLSKAGVSLAETAGVTFDIKAEGASVNLKRAYVIVKTTDGSYQLPISISTAWQTVTLLWDHDAPEGFTAVNAIELQIGANSKQTPLTYTVRGLNLLKQK